MKTHKSCKISHTNKLNYLEVPLSSSKSESNRVLILNAFSTPPARINNLSDARDTRTMQRLLASEEAVLDVMDAGTTMRFLIAYHAVSQSNVVLTGTKRMLQRPVKILVDALKTLGAEIDYTGEHGYPPVRLKPFGGQKATRLEIRGDVSSQYISALLMISPVLPRGLEIKLAGKVMSKPYIEMTLSLMKHFGIDYQWLDDIIQIAPQSYKPVTYTVESDWSGASYWFSMVALAEQAEIKLLNLREKSLQGDKRIIEIMEPLGVQASFDENGVVLTKKAHENTVQFDFSDCPDLAQTVAVTCAAKQIHCTMTGLESLRIKETDRIAALQHELAKTGTQFTETDPGQWQLVPNPGTQNFENLTIATYEDHRMAMAFAPLATMGNLVIEDPSVVEKSYPGFWTHMKMAGFELIIDNG